MKKYCHSSILLSLGFFVTIVLWYIGLILCLMLADREQNLIIRCLVSASFMCGGTISIALIINGFMSAIYTDMVFNELIELAVNNAHAKLARFSAKISLVIYYGLAYVVQEKYHDFINIFSCSLTESEKQSLLYIAAKKHNLAMVDKILLFGVGQDLKSSKASMLDVTLAAILKFSNKIATKYRYMLTYNTKEKTALRQQIIQKLLDYGAMLNLSDLKVNEIWLKCSPQIKKLIVPYLTKRQFEIYQSIALNLLRERENQVILEKAFNSPYSGLENLVLMQQNSCILSLTMRKETKDQLTLSLARRAITKVYEKEAKGLIPGSNETSRRLALAGLVTGCQSSNIME